ncbi:MAG: integration host factor subunit alpha [Alphaproteobacteria bacterium]|nr:integration host factor subunit alpha [Alphaproteobacteria bacterium]
MEHPSKTITRADLAEAVYEQVGLSRNDSSDLVEQILDEMMAALTSGDNVKISSFGSFSVREKGERIGRNPKTGVEVPISPRKVLVFRASHVLKDRINKATKQSQEGSSDNEGDATPNADPFGTPPTDRGSF